MYIEIFKVYDFYIKFQQFIEQCYIEIIMSDFFQEKKNSQKHFRDKINQFIKQSPNMQFQNQLDQSTITSILSGCKSQIIQNGRISLDKLFQLLKQQQIGYNLSLVDFRTIFGTQKSIKISDLSNILKDLNLNTFDIKTQIKNMCFQNKKFSFDKLDKEMKKIGQSYLNKKNKQLLIDCFDFNNDHIIDDEDLNILVELIKSRKQPNI